MPGSHYLLSFPCSYFSSALWKHEVAELKPVSLFTSGTRGHGWTPEPPAAASGLWQAAASLSFWQKHLNFFIDFFCDLGVTYKCVFSFSTFGDFPEIFLQLISNLILSG